MFGLTQTTKLKGAKLNSRMLNTIPPSYQVEYLVIAGGGSSGKGNGSLGAPGGGGAGGYRNSTIGETTGGGGSAEALLSIVGSLAYAITVGAGGTGATTAGKGATGSDSVFSTITSGGGGGGRRFYF